MNPEIVNISAEEIAALLGRTKQLVSAEDYKLIKGLADSCLLLNQFLDEKKNTIARLLRKFFGPKTEKNPTAPKKSPPGTKKQEKEPAAGHGKNSADDYPGATNRTVDHPTLKHCDPCPLCPDGKIYRQEPSRLVRITGTVPLAATIYELEKFRCNICGTLFTAPLPEEAGSRKYDETAGALLAVYHYGCGFPLNRLATVQNSFGVPMPASTQWEVIESTANAVHPIQGELIRQAAVGTIIHNDDTNMVVQELLGADTPDGGRKHRKVIFTTGIVSTTDDGKTIAIFRTGHRHAGENLATVLQERPSGLPPPIQMCDALSRNTAKEFTTILANCLSHGRRHFVELGNTFPEQCQYVIDILGAVYEHDATTKAEAMAPGQRLDYHIANSGPLIDTLYNWMDRQFTDKLVEPNSALGKAINYMRKHRQALTLFLRVEGAPLDNNICERALKMAIMHRKNSLYYKTEHGAWIGDMFMSIIHTCNFAKANPFDYLTTLQKNSSALFANPSQWLPWNYQDTFAAINNS